MRRAVRRIAQAFRRYAAAQGWERGDYRILAEVNPDWDRIHFFVIARQFPGDTPQDHWNSVIDFLEKDLKDEPTLLESMNLTLQTFEQVEQGGIYSPSPDYFDVDELFASEQIS